MNFLKPTGTSPYRMQTMLVFTALAAASMVYGPGTGHIEPKTHQRDPMVLIASPNDPLMIKAISFAQGSARNRAGGSAWSKPKADGSTARFTTPAGSITLSRAEIAEANFIYPQLKQRARDGHHYSTSGGSADAGFSDGDTGEWSDQAR